MTWDEWRNKLKIPDDYITQIETSIECPQCGKHIYFDSTIVLLSNPPQYKYWCECGWVEYSRVKWNEAWKRKGKAANESFKKRQTVFMDWVPCSDRLPDSNGEYLVTTKDGEVYQDTLQFLCQWDDCGDDVIAWMPLPKPYQEDNQ